MTATTPTARQTLDEYANRPDDTVEAGYRHLDRHRRVRVGPAVTVVFEDRHTLWFRIQELSRLARGTPVGPVRRQLDWYRRLMPGDGRLLAAVWVSARGRAGDALRAAVANGTVALRSDAGHVVPGTYLPERVSDRLIGLVRWAEFRFAPATRLALHDPTVGWELTVEAEGYPSAPTRLSETVIESLSADLV